MVKDYYKILNVTVNSTKDEIKREFRKLAKKNHPDLNKGDKEVEEKFKLMVEAYEILIDDEKRQRYDSGEEIDFNIEEVDIMDVLRSGVFGEFLDISEIDGSKYKISTLDELKRKEY